MHKFLFITCVAALTMPTPAAADVLILGEWYDAQDVCPAAKQDQWFFKPEKCVLKGNGNTATYIGGDKRYVDLHSNGDPKVTNFLGHMFTRSISDGQPYCQNSMSDALRQYAADSNMDYVTEPVHSQFTIKSKVTKIVGADLGFDAATMAQQANIPTEQIGKVTAELKAIYSRVRRSEIELVGTFGYFRINPDIVTAFNSADGPADLKACKEWLKTNGKYLISGLTGYKLQSAKASSALTDKIETELKTRLGTSVSDAQITALKTNYASTIERTVENRFEPHFELFSVSMIPE